jgi:hypothetical protein
LIEQPATKIVTIQAFSEGKTIWGKTIKTYSQNNFGQNNSKFSVNHFDLNYFDNNDFLLSSCGFSSVGLFLSVGNFFSRRFDAALRWIVAKDQASFLIENADDQIKIEAHRPCQKNNSLSEIKSNCKSSIFCIPAAAGMSGLI